MNVHDHVLSETNNTPTPFANGALFITAILSGIFLGLLAPTSSERLSGGIDLTLLLMIFLIFFELSFKGVMRGFSNLKFLTIAWCSNFLIIPVIGLVIASLLLSRESLLFVALMIYFLAPCTDWFLGFTRLAKGDTELGAALIPINLISQLLLFPLWLWLLTKDEALVEYYAIPTMLIQWFIVPLLVAQTLRLAFERISPVGWSENILSWINLVVPFVLAAFIVQIFAAHIATSSIDLELLVIVVIAVCMFFAVTSIVGECLSHFGRLQYSQKTLLSMTMAARNAPLMLALTAIAIPNEAMVLTVIVLAMLVEIPLLTALNRLILARGDRQ